MRKLAAIGILFFLSFASCAHSSAQSLPQNSIEGVWSLVPYVMEVGSGGFHVFDLSWGRREFPRIIDIVVDLHNAPPIFIIPEFTESEIININEKGNITELTFYFPRGGFNVTAIFRFDKDGTMWIESYEGEDGRGFSPGGTGRDFVYHRIDGPARDRNAN